MVSPRSRRALVLFVVSPLSCRQIAQLAAPGGAPTASVIVCVQVTNPARRPRS